MSDTITEFLELLICLFYLACKVAIWLAIFTVFTVALLAAGAVGIYIIRHLQGHI